MGSNPKVETSLRHAQATIRKVILHREQKQESEDSYVTTGEIYQNTRAFHW